MFRSIIAIKNFLYDTRRLRPIRSSAYVISVGNITWGGTGKTTIIIQLTKHFIEQGYRVAVISRGYRRKSSGLKLVSDGKKILESWEQAGDEPYLIAQHVPAAMVVVARKRAEAFRFLQQFSPQIVLLDDAFQHRRAARDLDIVLIDGSEDLQQQHLIPFGKLREPLSSLHRADAVILTHAQHAVASTELWLRRNIAAPYFRADYVGKQNWNGQRLAAFCGIGSPQHFFDLLKDNDARLVVEHPFHDHHVYTDEELLELQREARIAGADGLITTAKDAVKIKRNLLQLPLMVAEVEFRMDRIEEFYQFLTSKIQQRVTWNAISV